MMADENADDTIGLARNRSRREGKRDKGGRLAALERLKKAKEGGGKNKYEVTDELDVYEEVDENEYSEIVRQRQEDDWIVDDDGSGYVEDGREIFDDEFDGRDNADQVQGKGNKKGASKKRLNPNIRAPDSKPKSIKSLFAAAAVKTKPKVEQDVNLNDDDLLGDIMSELHKKPTSGLAPPPVKLKKKPLTPKSALNPFSTKATVKKPNPIKTAPPPAMNNSGLNNRKYDDHEDPPIQNIPPVKMAASRMKTALDDLDSQGEHVVSDSQEESPVIDEFESQKTSSQDQHAMQTQEDIIDFTPSTDVDVSGINFDDDMMDVDNSNQAMTASNNKNKRNFVTVESNKESDTPMNGAATTWETGKADVSEIPTDIIVDSSKLPLTKNEDGEQVLRMYWLDAYEDAYKQPGVIYLFGKVWIESAKAHASCCVAVKNMERKVYILPRETKMNTQTWEPTAEEVSFLDVYKEFNDKIAEKYKIMKFKSMKVTRQYCFEKSGIPASSEYMEVRYPAEYPELPADLRGETFSHVFGTNTSCLENFLLDRKLKGPCWLDIKMPQVPNASVSWCKVEAFVNKVEYITIVTSQPAIPPLVVMTLYLRTLPNPKTHQNEVIAASGLVQYKFHLDKPAPKPAYQQHFCVIGKPNDCVYPYDFKEQVQKQSSSMKVEVMGNERALLGFLLAKIHKLDPDVIVGHDMFGFHLDVLIHRINQNKIPHWSRIGRLKRANMPKLYTNPGHKGGVSTSATCGRLVCDVQVSAKELIRCKSYDLTQLVHHLLREKRHEVDTDEIPSYYNNSKHLLQLLDWTLHDSSFILKIMYDLMVLPLALQITGICGNVMARTLMGGRSERNEYLLLHAFTEKGFIVPDKSYSKKIQQTQEEAEDQDNTTSKKSGRRKPAYTGGLVLEPKKGFYDKFILLLDFNSLYPSIIQEYNICFTTIDRTHSNADQKDAENEDEFMNFDLPDPDLEPGILPTEIRKLVQSRRQVKAMMKDTNLPHETYIQYDIRQKALKLTANSMYGCLGFSFSRFYAKPLAAMVTGKGREILMKTKDLVQNMNLEVIYGDTDSIMVNTNSTDFEQVFKLGNKVKAEVNKLYKLLEIDIDGVFKSMLLLKKKKYAALTVSKVGDSYVTSQELKGLDIVRRDWCELAKEAGNFVVSEILSGESRESIVENIHSKLLEVGQKVKEGSIPIELYYITKQLTKNPEDYPDKKSLAHVQVALRLNSKGGRKLRSGDTVYYVICQDGTTLGHSQRAYHPDEVLKSETLSVDTQYYLANQVHPVVARLCDPIDGTDAARIAECLGLDPAGYRQSMRSHDNEEEDALLGGADISEEEKYKDCDRYKWKCPKCQKEIIVDAVFTGVKEYITCTLEKCPECKLMLAQPENLPLLKNHLTQCIRGHIKRYYQGWLKCEDSTCGARVKKLPLTFHRGHPVCQMCNRGLLHPEYSDSELYHQLCFYQFIFDLDKAMNRMTDPIERDFTRRIFANKSAEMLRSFYRQLRCHVDKTIRHSAYNEVNLNRLFEGLFGLR